MRSKRWRHPLRGSFRLAAVLGLALALPVAAGRPDEAAPPILTEARRAGLIKSVQEMATWCQSQALLAERSRLAGAMLGRDPEQETARKWLRHRRTKD